MNGQTSLKSLLQCLDAIEQADRRLVEQEATLVQTYHRQKSTIEARRLSAIEEFNRLTAALNKIQDATVSELQEVGLDSAKPDRTVSANVPQIPSNPHLADLSTLVKQVAKRAAALESSLRELEHHRDLEAKAARVAQTLKSQAPPNPVKPIQHLITPPPPPIRRPTASPAYTAWLTALIMLGSIAILALTILLYYLFTK